MDIKSKSNKKFSYLMALVWVMLAAAVFLAFYPVLKEQASYYYTDQLKSDQLLRQMYQGNLVLYKNMLGRTGQEDVSYADLYLKFEEEDIAREEIENNGYYVEEERTAGALKILFEENLNNLLEGWKSEMWDSVARNMDYCVIDHKSGEILKNTSREIEKLKSKETVADYSYYVMMNYDNAGNLASVSVRDEEADELLKNVQRVMSGEWLKYLLNDRLRYETNYRQEFYFDDLSAPEQEESGDEESPGHYKKMSLSVNDGPKDMTFIYALTPQQKQNMFAMWQNGATSGNYRWEISTAYYEAGTGGIYAVILLVLLVLALLMTRSRRYCLHRLGGFHLYLEFALCGMVCAAAIFSEWAVRLVYCTNNGFFEDFYERYFTAMPSEFYPAVTIVINVVMLALQFGSWFYLATTFGEVFEIGITGFLKNRSLIIRLWERLASGGRRRLEEFKKEILHVDLGGETEKTIRKLLLLNFIILAVACSMWMFGYMAIVVYTVILYFLLKKYINKIQGQYRQLFIATRSIADGNLQTEFSNDWGVFESYKQELSRIQNGFKAAVDKEVRSQKMKTELITNVSHDLKTPLTAITTYVELLEDESISPQQRKEYLLVLKKKSQRLKFLIEDLFEVSKASSGNITLNPVDVDICNLMRQVYLEYEDRVEEAELIFRFHLPEEKVILKLDSQKTYRVFENLYINIIKYAMPHTRVYVSAEKTQTGIHIEMKNMSATELDIAPEELTERFVRGDSSRNTEGSGLGLAIARSFVELQGGRLKVEIDGDLFKVKIEW